MQKKTGEFSMEDMQKLAQSPAGQQLLTLLQSSNDPAIAQAVSQAEAGNYDQVKQSLTALLQNVDIRNLLRQLGG